MKFVSKLLGIALGIHCLNAGTGAYAQTITPEKAPAARAEQARNAVIDVGALDEFELQPPAVQRLIRKSLELVEKDLKYKYGSADPAQGGMDCSGTIYYLLGQQGLKGVPRSSDSQYHWVLEKGIFQGVSATSLDSPEFSRLKPGDLLFWSGTYATSGISHVMIYLGKQKSDGKRVMIGSSQGRRYGGIARNGVSVFDFVLPKSGGGAKFVGYGPVPGVLEAKSRELKASMAKD